jgi:hypothetical protein
VILSLFLIFLFSLTFLAGLIAERLGIQRFIFHKYLAYALFIFLTWHIISKLKILKNYLKKKRKYLLPVLYLFIFIYFAALLMGIIFWIL